MITWQRQAAAAAAEAALQHQDVGSDTDAKNFENVLLSLIVVLLFLMCWNTRRAGQMTRMCSEAS